MFEDRPNFVADGPCREAGEQTFDSHSTSRSLDGEDVCLNEIVGARQFSRPKRPLPPRSTRSSFPLTSNIDISMTPEYAPTFRKRARRSAPESHEGLPVPTAATVALAPEEYPTEFQGRMRPRPREVGSSARLDAQPESCPWRFHSPPPSHVNGYIQHDSVTYRFCLKTNLIFAYMYPFLFLKFLTFGGYPLTLVQLPTITRLFTTNYEIILIIFAEICWYSHGRR